MTARCFFKGLCLLTLILQIAFQPGTSFEIVRCKKCGSKAVHVGCGNLLKEDPLFVCSDHDGAEEEMDEHRKKALENTNRGKSSRKSRTRATAQVRLFLSCKGLIKVRGRHS